MKRLTFELPALTELLPGAPTCRTAGCEMPTRSSDGFCGGCRGVLDERQRARREAKERLAASGMPGRYLWSAFSAPELAARVRNPNALRAAEVWASAPKLDRVVLMGSTGVGKTSLACAILRHLIVERGMRGTFADDLQLATARKNVRLGSEAELISRATLDDCVLVDDLGQAPGTDHTGGAAYVIFERHAHMRTTLITTFCEPRQIADRFGAGIARRVFEGATVIRCGT